MTSQYKGSKVGFPIRRSLDQSSFAAPQGISQRTTSFIASQRQGIHQMLLRHLITLMINVRSAEPNMTIKERPVLGFLPKHVFACQTYPAHTAAGRGWFAGLGCLLAEYVASLRFQTSASSPARGEHEPQQDPERTRAQWTPDTARKGPKKIVVEPVGIEPTT
jgi:hypothetical protein